jgi:ELWxxDGT repeat protein
MNFSLVRGPLGPLVISLLVMSSAADAQPAFQVKDICPGPCSFQSRIGVVGSALLDLGGTLLFEGDDGVTGPELWRSDGSADGTFLVKDLQEYFTSHPRAFTLAGGQAYFVADAPYGYAELWRSDGTTAGTVNIQAYGYGANLYEPGHLTVLGDSLFFSAEAGFETKNLWATTPPGGAWPAAARAIGGNQFSYPRGLTVFQGNLIFSTIASGELWIRSDSLLGSGPVLFDIHPDPVHLTRASQLTVVGDQLFFAADDGTTGLELWKTDGTKSGTLRVKDIRTGPGSSMQELYDRLPYFDFSVSAGGKLFFVADDGITGRELWLSDGTEAGTFQVKDIHPGLESANISNLTAAGRRVFFGADDGVHGNELWVSDGTPAGTFMLQDIFPGFLSSNVHQFLFVRNVVLFSATDDVHGIEPWVSDGTPAGTRLLQDISPGAGSLSSVPTDFTTSGSLIYFAADDGSTGVELWALPKSAVGSVFEDVPQSYWAWPYVEALAENNLTTGCGGGLYCPARAVSRAEMAVFVLRIAHGNTYVPPDVATTRFADVPAGHWATDWIEQLAVEGITSGCNVSPPLYCPDSATSRDQMAVFLLRALHGSDYTPPPATGTRFTDVPAGYWAAAWIEQLAAEGITTGCADNRYCPGDPVSREQMAVFLTRALNLTLP